MSLDFNPPAFKDGSRLKLPLAVMAGNRPSYLLRMLLSLRGVEGLDPSLVTVFIDGYFDEPSSVARLFELNVEQHAGSGKRNSRICQVISFECRKTKTKVNYIGQEPLLHWPITTKVDNKTNQ